MQLRHNGAVQSILNYYPNQMGNFAVLFALVVVFADVFCSGMVLNPVDGMIQLRLLEFTQGRSLADGLVLAGTIVEGGPVSGRPRRILGGKTVHPGVSYLNLPYEVDTCPPVTFGYHCLDWVSKECDVTRHLLHDMKLCTCKTDVC